MKLGKCLQECKRGTTSREFVMWKIVRDREWDVREKMDFYLAQIAAEMRKSWVKNKRSVKDEDFLIKFKRKRVDGKKTEEEAQAELAESKRFWKTLASQPKGIPPNIKLPPGVRLHPKYAAQQQPTPPPSTPPRRPIRGKKQ